MPVRKINNSWWIDIRHHRKRYRKKSPENSRAGAQVYEATLRQKLIKGELLDENKKLLSEKKQKFEVFAKNWFEVYVKNNNKLSEINGKKIILEKHLIPFFGKTPVDSFSLLQIEKFKAQKIEMGLANKTINNYLTVFNTCLKTAQEWLELEKIPKVKRLKVKPCKIDFLTHKESQLLLNNAIGLWYEMISFALKTGLRFGELRSLEWTDINWQTGILTVRRSVFRGVIVSPKSNKERHIPLAKDLLEILGAHKQKEGYIFSIKNSIIEENRVRRELWRACNKAGIRKVGWHTLRHTFASHLAMAGASLKAIQELLGHSDIQTTMRYAHLTSSTLKEAVDLLPNHNKNYFGQYLGNEEKIMKEFVGNNSINMPTLWLDLNKNKTCKSCHEIVEMAGIEP